MATTLDKTISDLTKHYGKKVIMKASEMHDIRKIPTDVPAYDYLMTGGVPINRIIELYGDFSSLKSWISQVAVGKFQKYDWANQVPNVISKVIYKRTKSKSHDEELKGLELLEVEKVILRRGYKPKKPVRVKRCAWIDFEGTYDPAMGKRLGVDSDALLYIQPESLNKGVDIIQALLMDPEICLVVIDSMVAIGSDGEADKSMEDEQMAVNARFWNKATRKMQGAINANPEKDVTLIGINAAYDKVGIAYGSPEKVKNGKQWSLAKSMSIRSTALKEIKSKEEGKDVAVGRNIGLKNMKNKVGRPFLESNLYYSFVDDGLIGSCETDIYQQILDLGSDYGLIQRSGATYKFGEIKLATGLENTKNYLKDNPDVFETIKNLVYEKF